MAATAATGSTDGGRPESSTPSEVLIVPGDAGYFDALGADAFAVEANRTDAAVSTDDRSLTGEIHRDGRIHEISTVGDTSDEVWVHDGQIYVDVDGTLEPRLFAPDGSLGFIKLGELAFPVDEGTMARLQPGDVIERGGELLREFTVDPDAMLAWVIESNPPFHEFTRAEVRVLANTGGALVWYESVLDAVYHPAPNQVNPPPPLEVEGQVTTIAITPGAAPAPFPSDRVAANQDELLLRQMLDRVLGDYGNAFFEAFVRNGGSYDGMAPVTAEEMAARLTQLGFADRMGITLGPMAEAGPSTIGYDGGYVAMAIDDSSWLCAAWPDPIGDTPRVTGSGATLEAALADCRSQIVGR